MRLINALPPHSRYFSAMLDDPEVAAAMVDIPEPTSPELRMEGFDPHRALLTALLDAINLNTQAVIAAAGADPPKMEPAPRPVTELDRMRNRARHYDRRSLAALALGKDVSEIE